MERLHETLQDPAIRSEAIASLQGLIDTVVVHPTENGQEIELIGEIARMVELGLPGEGNKKAALDERAACSVKVVAGTGFEPVTFRL